MYICYKLYFNLLYDMEDCDFCKSYNQHVPRIDDSHHIIVGKIFPVDYINYAICKMAYFVKSEDIFNYEISNSIEQKKYAPYKIGQYLPLQHFFWGQIL